MKVALLINELDIRGGTHKQFLRLAQYLKSENVDFTIITKYYDKNSTYPEFSDFEINFLSKNKKRLNIIGKINQFINILQKIPKNTNIINIHDNGFLPIIPFLKLFNKKIIWQINDLPSYFREGNCKSIQDNYKNVIKRFLTRLIAKYFVDEITVNVTKNKLRVLKNLSLDAKVFYCGVDKLNGFKIHTSNNKETINLLTTGVFFSYRNYETSIEIVKKLLSLGYECRLDIIGDIKLDPIYVNKIKTLIDMNNLQEYIIIHGQVDESKFKSLFNDSDIFLFLNLDQSWGLVVFEAMSVGIPTIVSESVGAVEILSNEEALIVDPLSVDDITEKIILLNKDKSFYEKYSKNSIKHVESMSWDLMYSSNVLKIMKDIDDTN
ncbi:glycosyltransferase [Aliarcobacter skirrowii]|uniref:glycosyltransferase family 4 protein n=1 Tax=Aliarcobacter skirrowii TaxID=28200 RepID=UPI000F68F005|nr:glycosyltransferase family 4 protein [Aliarcobacter skirrowii]AZL54038.1 glycosyltransferase [Aliarcobacter skirrowii]